MIEWVDFEKNLSNCPIHTIDNKSNKNIVLFGNCHVATIGYFLNHMLNQQYNIFIIISWFCDKVGFDKFNMTSVNQHILYILENYCDIFLYQQHIKDYGVNASFIETLVNKKAAIYKLPNLRLTFNTLDKTEYERSLGILSYNISHSDFSKFDFIIKYLNNIRFFNTPDHPTHYLLYLLSKYILNKIENNGVSIGIEDFNNKENQLGFKEVKEFVILPGFDVVTSDISQLTGISMNALYID